MTLSQREDLKLFIVTLSKIRSASESVTTIAGQCKV
uniref:Uncharacterized protein n=1 Tax=Anguilla anguilla TaxID=7936 RepID=A0A0E9WIE6_ANGAN